jgi:hypothetical protein
MLTCFLAELSCKKWMNDYLHILLARLRKAVFLSQKDTFILFLVSGIFYFRLCKNLIYVS